MPVDIALQEAAGVLRDYADKLEADPDKLEEVETRLAAVQKLKRKYGGSVAEIIAFGEQANSQIAAVESANERKAAVEKRRGELEFEFERVSAELRTRRSEAAVRLGSNVQLELQSLGMAKTIFEIRLRDAAWVNCRAGRRRIFVVS